METLTRFEVDSWRRIEWFYGHDYSVARLPNTHFSQLTNLTDFGVVFFYFIESLIYPYFSLFYFLIPLLSVLDFVGESDRKPSGDSTPPTRVT